LNTLTEKVGVRAVSKQFFIQRHVISPRSFFLLLAA
jgi:hypothetical protein